MLGINRRKILYVKVWSELYDLFYMYTEYSVSIKTFNSNYPFKTGKMLIILSENFVIYNNNLLICMYKWARVGLEFNDKNTNGDTPNDWQLVGLPKSASRLPTRRL